MVLLNHYGLAPLATLQSPPIFRGKLFKLTEPLLNTQS